MTKRHTQEQLETWRREGGVKIEKFFTPDEIAAVAADFEVVFADAIAAARARTEPANGSQFANTRTVPFNCSPALNLIGVHPALIALAKEALQVDRVHLYQCQAWAKFTGEADYDQPFHCDYTNHTITAPSEDAARSSITIICYFNDLTEAHGPMHYVARTDSSAISGPEITVNSCREAQADLQQKLAAFEKSTAGPAGTIFPYSIDVFHRGTDLTAPDGYRYAVMTCFKAAGNDGIGFTAWPYDLYKPWPILFEHATPEQLSCFGVPLPGDGFWTETTIARTQYRYPAWNCGPYREAMRAGEPVDRPDVATN